MTGVEKLIRSAGRAYQRVCAGAPDLQVGPTAELEYGEYIIHLWRGLQADELTDSGLTVGEIERIVTRLKIAERERQQLHAAERFEEDVLQRLADANNELADTSKDFRKRQSEALRILGLIGNAHNEGSVTAKRKYKKMASHYNALRSGTGWHSDNGFDRLQPRSHKDAVEVIEKMYEISWRELQRNCNKHDIWLNKDCERYPTK
ncbi:hypothetical protein KQ940_11250 [Marinobacterium sp. D7]|uniref:hypothetical protein n=1 Tax=Marinobacterium ramblicola TaxID=2849041 RepID=UPI001C2DF07E|nr:hypothetical protein [Marinobacterium ramblicola]MBV1788630.1 hypothetical protein [Marinobacterium ramblicola]